jgi:hydrogenase maturation protease
MDALVIGYGNPLRGDDGAGPRVADAVAAWNRPGVRTITVHQLTPELADVIATARRVVFVDAEVGTVRVGVNRLEVCDSAYMFVHVGNPAWLMGLTRAVYGRCPPAWLVTVPGTAFGFGERLSETARLGIADAQRSIADLLEIPVSAFGKE